MMNRIPLTIAAVAALTLAACVKEPLHDGDPAKIAETIKAQEMQWQKAYADKDLEALAGFYAAGAALADPGSALATTDVARRKEIQTLTSDPNLKLTFASDRVQVARSGDLAYSRGHFAITTTDRTTNKPVSSDGYYLTVWQKQDNGSWKAVEDFITPGPAAAAAK